ncbi:MAG: ShlB/FhaC/HecB family hemolysin secretion/activation protein [Rhodoferax sp.]|uniref:ShlB/FhaC/HecB family hemolysin secretion/activation protein n=1 Tax=Rhodoferax sp. TaxID=50421 RepID=UPI0013FFD11D|nr:ShlB/FhaC/HecB family hemolysin secretion/activation protein [Rhodoferax sp.]NDP38542.1 ShlB/FhaC/HecB family hemolysin secretion/activation protein [Rhodoferax sp.]
MLKNKFIPCALLALSPAVFAAPPDAGSQMQQIPPAPIQRPAEPGIDFKPISPAAMAAPDNARITVNQLRVTGAKVYSEADLLAITGFKAGSELSLTDLRGMAARIADHYHRNGYFVAQAYLPAQDIKNGIVTIAVIDGQYGKVALNNQTNVSNALANNLLSGLNSGDVVASGPLENRLLLLSDLPGVKVNSTLVPGATVGSSDLLVNMTQGPRISGSIDADNAGNYYTGEYRIGATVNYNEPLGLGDVASLRVLTSGKGLNYARGSYQLQLGKATVGVAYSALEYELSRGAYEGLGYNGTAKVASLYGSYPLIRSRNNNLYAGLSYDDKTFEDNINSTTLRDKKAQVLTASLSGNRRDSLGGGGVTGYSLALSAGNIDNSNPGEINGNFNKLGFSLSRLQRVTDTVSLSAVANGQLASTALDSSEQMELGGMYGVRAYPEGEGYGDEGVVLNLEARMQLPKFSDSMPGQLQLIGFVDAGTVRAHNADDRRTLSGAGVGLNWSDTNNFMVRAYYAGKIGDEDATSAPDKSGRFWIQAVKYF